LVVTKEDKTKMKHWNFLFIFFQKENFKTITNFTEKVNLLKFETLEAIASMNFTAWMLQD